MLHLLLHQVMPVLDQAVSWLKRSDLGSGSGSVMTKLFFKKLYEVIIRVFSVLPDDTSRLE